MENAKSVRNPKGTIFLDGKESADTMQCCHCGAHFIMVHGSGKTRGWCMNCGDLTCGKPRCNPCLPFEKRMTLYEKGLIDTL